MHTKAAGVGEYAPWLVPAWQFNDVACGGAQTHPHPAVADLHMGHGLAAVGKGHRDRVTHAAKRQRAIKQLRVQRRRGGDAIWRAQGLPVVPQCSIVLCIHGESFGEITLTPLYFGIPKFPRIHPLESSET